MWTENRLESGGKMIIPTMEPWVSPTTNKPEHKELVLCHIGYGTAYTVCESYGEIMQKMKGDK